MKIAQAQKRWTSVEVEPSSEPMEVDALQKGSGKGKGESDKSNGKGKSGDKGKGKSKDKNFSQSM